MPMESKPFFSLIVPSYNPNVEYFRICMDSLLNQSYREYEIIILDDGSEKEWTALFDSYSYENENVSVLHQENEGVSVARNKGILLAKADWLIFVDADDWMEKDALEKLHGYLCEMNCDILLYHAVKEFATHCKEMKYGFDANCYYDMSDIKVKEKLYKRAMSVPNFEAEDCCVIYYSWDKVFARSFLLNNNLRYPTGIENSEDKVFILQCFRLMKRMYVVNDILYHYRVNDASASKKYKEKADSQRTALTVQLENIARSMDSELARKSGNYDYHYIYDEYMRFCFGIISDVFNYKFYHQSYPRDNRCRREEVKAFLKTYPFNQAIKHVHYKDLSNVAKIKKLLLTCHMPTLFYFLKSRRMRKAGNIPVTGE